jgi:CspA family cold shock protein
MHNFSMPGFRRLGTAGVAAGGGAKRGKKRKCGVIAKPSCEILGGISHCLRYQGRRNRRILMGRTCRFAGTGRSFLIVLIPRRRRMAKGTVKWFNPTKGYGFIQPASGGKDVFVHISAVQKAGLSTLNEGQTIEYEEIANRGKTSAENIKV